jgi:hypothetical protein
VTPRTSADDELITRPGQSNVEPLARTLALGCLVDNEDDGATFQALEPEHVTVEHLVGVPEGVPVGGLPIPLSGRFRPKSPKVLDW